MRVRKTAVAFAISVSAILSLTGCGGLKMVAQQPVAKETSNEKSADNDSSDAEVTKEPVKMMSDSQVIGKETNEKLEEIEGMIDKYFYFEDDDQTKQENLIKGYMNGLDDPYSVYYTKEEFDDFMESTGGEYVGVGVQVSQNADTKVITVVKVFDGPAKEAGIEAEDIIEKVDGEDISGQDIDKVVDKIKGTEGTDVTITVYRSSEGKDLDFTMPRRKVENPTVEYKMLDNNIGYIQVSAFYEVTGEQFKKAVDDLDSQGMEAMIVDLRDNGGGLLDIAADMLDYLLPAGKIVYTKDKDGNILSEENSTDEDQFTKPLAVLVNGYSASASEIFAGAIKDYGIGTLVGTNTFGKGIVQRMFPLADGSGIKLTIAKYFTPNGNDIHKIGIKPDVEIELDVDAFKESKGEKDNQLDAAIDDVLVKLGKKSPSSTEAAKSDSADADSAKEGTEESTSEEAAGE